MARTVSRPPQRAPSSSAPAPTGTWTSSSWARIASRCLPRRGHSPSHLATNTSAAGTATSDGAAHTECPTIDKLHQLGLGAVAAAWTEQQQHADVTSLAFDERFG